MRKPNIEKQIKSVFGSESGKDLLRELYSIYCDRTLIGVNEMETGRNIGQHELVQDLIRIVYGKSFVSDDGYGKLYEDN